MSELAKVTKKTALLDIEHKIGLAVFILIGIIGIPLTLANSSKNNPNTHVKTAQVAHPALQVGYFDPSIYKAESDVDHAPGEIIVRYYNNVKIQTRGGVNQDTSPFQIDDITSSTPSDVVNNLKKVSISSIEKVFPNTNPNTNSAKTFISNVYKVKLAHETNIAGVMQTLCGNSQITIYCEPNYTFSLAIPSGTPQKIAAYRAPPNTLRTNTANNAHRAKVALIDSPLPTNYAQLAGNIGLPSISQEQILPGGESPRTDTLTNHALQAAGEINQTNPNTEVIFSGACGDTCANDSIAKGIVYAADNNASVIYIGATGSFPKGIEPLSIISAADYALSRGVRVVATTGNAPQNKIKSAKSSFNFVTKLFSVLNIVRSAFAQTDDFRVQPDIPGSTPLGPLGPGVGGDSIPIRQESNKSQFSGNPIALKLNMYANNPGLSSNQITSLIEQNTDGNGTVDVNTLLRQAQSTKGQNPTVGNISWPSVDSGAGFLPNLAQKGTLPPGYLDPEREKAHNMTEQEKILADQQNQEPPETESEKMQKELQDRMIEEGLKQMSDLGETSVEDVIFERLKTYFEGALGEPGGGGTATPANIGNYAFYTGGGSGGAGAGAGGAGAGGGGAGAGGGGCFLPGTQILMSDGKSKSIENVNVGDKILTKTEDASSGMTPDTIVDSYHIYVTSYFTINNRLNITPLHRTFINGRWDQIKNAKIGDNLLGQHGEEIKITSIVKHNGDFTVYNLTTSYFHTFFAEGFYVHNVSGLSQFEDPLGKGEGGHAPNDYNVPNNYNVPAANNPGLNELQANEITGQEQQMVNEQYPNYSNVAPVGPPAYFDPAPLILPFLGAPNYGDTPVDAGNQSDPAL